MLAAVPVSVTAVRVAGPDTKDAAQVSATYTTPSLIPIHGLLSKQFTITRVVTMRLPGCIGETSSAEARWSNYRGHFESQCAGVGARGTDR